MEETTLQKCSASPDCQNLVRPGVESCKSCAIIEANRLEAEKKAEKKRERDRERKRKERADNKAERERQKAIADAEKAAEEFDSPEPCKRDDAKDILRDRRNLTQEYVIDAAYNAGLIAARRLGHPSGVAETGRGRLINVPKF